MLMVAALVALFAYGRVTSEWSAKPFLIIAGVVVALVGLAAFTRPLTIPALLIAAVVDFIAAVAIFALGYALGRWLDRDKYA